MYIARKLKKENICEYLLYMWQIEDLMRAFQLNLTLVNEQIVQKYQLTEEDKKSLYEWYESIIDMMRKENVETNGHIQINKNVIIELNDLHNDLLSTGENPSYSAKFYHILPDLTQIRKQQDNSSLTDIELCFIFMYGIMMLRIKKLEIRKETLRLQEEVSKFLVLLSKSYLNLQKLNT